MRSEFKNRLFLPVVLPLLVLLVMALFIGGIALSLLYNTHEGALMLAIVAAGGILFMTALASTRDRLGTGRRTVVLFAALLPLILGVALGIGLIGDIDDADRNINTEPLLIIPDDAPLIAAENSVEFCLPDNGDCTPVEEWEFVPAAESDEVIFVFDNRETGVPHNVAIADVGGTPDSPAPGDTTYLVSETVTGPAVDEYVDPELTWDDLPDEWYFWCTIHPVMNGIGRVADEG